jgi:hypothetical protein
MGAARNNAGSSLDAIATAIFADIDVAIATLQDVLPMARVTHLASEASPRCAIEDALKASRMLAFMIILRLGEDSVNALTPLMRKYVWSSVSIYDLFGAFFDAMEICGGASTLLPTYTTDVAELRAAWTSTTD